MNETTRCGFVAIIGRPNVGKSTLLNAMVGQKISITCHKRQTTRHVVRGIKTLSNVQIIYVDTPGIHGQSKRALNRYMNQVAKSAVDEVDVILFLVSAEHWSGDDELVLERLRTINCPVILVVNKIDQIKKQADLLTLLHDWSSKMKFAEVVPVSAKNSKNITTLETVLSKYLPAGPFLYQSDQITDSKQQFMIAEIIREKLFQQVHQEVPYSATVLVDKIECEGNLSKIYATIYVEKGSQKAIVIGKQGSKLKRIGHDARLELERLLANKVYLELWVKVKEEWADNENMLRNLGFE